MTHNNNDVEIYTVYCVLTAIWQTVLVSFHHSPLQLRRNMLMSRSPSLLRRISKNNIRAIKLSNVRRDFCKSKRCCGGDITWPEIHQQHIYKESEIRQAKKPILT